MAKRSVTNEDKSVEPPLPYQGATPDADRAQKPPLPEIPYKPYAQDPPLCDPSYKPYTKKSELPEPVYEPYKSLTRAYSHWPQGS
jgi:hypothetical protein